MNSKFYSRSKSFLRMLFMKFIIIVPFIFQSFVFTQGTPPELKTGFNSLLRSAKSMKASLNYALNTAAPVLDYKSLALSGCFFTAGVGLLYLLWKQIDKENMSYEQRFKEKVDELHAVNINVTQERWGSIHKIIIHKPNYVSHEIEQLIERIKPELIRIKDEQYNKNMQFSLKNCGMVVELLGMFTLFRLSWAFFLQGIYPDHKINYN